MTGGLVALLIVAAVPAGMDSAAYFRYVQSQFMAPCCWSKTVDNERSSAGEDVRRIIRTRLDAGATEAEVREALVAQYGLRILSAPPMEGFQLTAWVMPFAALLLGGVGAGLFVRGMLRRRREATGGAPAGDAPPPQAADFDARLEQELRDYEDS